MRQSIEWDESSRISRVDRLPVFIQPKSWSELQYRSICCMKSDKNLQDLAVDLRPENASSDSGT